MSSKPIIPLEVCCGSAEDAIAAYRGGAFRVELCSDLFHGGLTPSMGTLKTVQKDAPALSVMCMVRPREGGFCYTATEFDVMLADAAAFAEAGAQGVVFGFLHEDGTIDAERCKKLLSVLPASCERVFHRAFDLTPDPFATMEKIIELGFTRILTSGQKPTVPEGVRLIRELTEKAGDRIEIMPGAGITPENAVWCKEQIGAKTLHVAMHRTQYDRSAAGNPAIYFGGAVYPPEDRFLVTDKRDVEAFLTTIA